jgi:hypothetical protein
MSSNWPSSAECISDCIDVLAAGIGLQQTRFEDQKEEEMLKNVASQY